MYADVCCGCVYAVCGECGGGGDGFEVTGGVWVSAFCAVYVGEVGVWVGWDVAWFACYCAGYSRTVFDVEVWTEVEEYESVCGRVVFNKPLLKEEAIIPRLFFATAISLVAVKKRDVIPS